MEEIKIKSHLIVTDIHEEYEFNWMGKILDAKPLLKNGKPIFAIVGGGRRMEVCTTDITRVEDYAKLCTRPRGRKAVTVDTARIYIKEVDDNERLLGILTHKHIKSYAPMYDSVGWK